LLQLLNILHKDIGIVGPRPPVPDGDSKYTAVELKVNKSIPSSVNFEPYCAILSKMPQELIVSK
jgi:hypothetical protein